MYLKLQSKTKTLLHSFKLEVLLPIRLPQFPTFNEPLPLLLDVNVTQDADGNLLNNPSTFVYLSPIA